MNICVKKIMKWLAMLMVVSSLTACGGGDGDATTTTNGPLTAAAIALQQSIVDVVEDVLVALDPAVAFLADELRQIQSTFDGIITILDAGTALLAGDIADAQLALDDYILAATGVGAGLEPLTASQIATAQAGLDAARPLL